MRGIENHLDEIERSGIRPVAISVDSPDISNGLYRRRGYTYTLLSDPNAEVIRRYDLLHPGAGIKGHDIARPAEFLVDTSGVIRWKYLTEDFRVRLRPDQILEAARTLK